MRNRPFWMLPMALLAALALVMAACGDDDESAGGDDQAATDDGGGAADGGAGPDEAEDAAENAAEDVIGSELGEECSFLGEFAGTGLEEAFDPAELFGGENVGEAFSALSDQFDEVASRAPEEIRDSFETLADGMSEFAEAIEGVDLTDPSQRDQEALEAFSQGPGEEFEAAAADVEAWMQENCAPGS